jgi:hypothetical protein
MTSWRMVLVSPLNITHTPIALSCYVLIWGAAFPPLLADVIAGDIHMKPYQVANSNIIALTATYVCLRLCSLVWNDS